MSAVDPELAASDPERSFYVDEFHGETIVVSLADLAEATLESVRTAATTLARGASRLVLVTGGSVDRLVAGLPSEPLVLEAPRSHEDAGWLAALWLAVTDHDEVVIRAMPGSEVDAASRVAVALRAHKLVLTDPGGGWGRPSRSFADVVTHEAAFREQLAERQGGALVRSLGDALAGGVTNVNLCRPADLDRELFTFDGAGTLFTSGGYVDVAPLRVDELPAVERLVHQGVADGLLRPRSRSEVARLAVRGLGARVVGSGHLAGLVSLDTERYEDDQVGEVACLYTVSRLSGSGAGAVLMAGLVDHARDLGLRSVFAVTVSEVAASFFVRRGFEEVGRGDVPAVKWAGYDATRLDRARVFRFDLMVDVQASLGF